jgi:hypothetical protein
MAWHGMTRHGMAWHDMAWHGMAWHGMAWWYVCAQGEVGGAHLFVETGRSRCLAMRGPGEGRGRGGDFSSSPQA